MLKYYLSYLFLIFTVGQVLACSCSPLPEFSYESYFREYIFVGEVVKTKAIYKSDDLDQVGSGGIPHAWEIKMIPLKIYKGRADDEGLMTIITKTNTCGVEISVGDFWYIFSDGEISQCGRSEKIVVSKNDAATYTDRLKQAIVTHEYTKKMNIIAQLPKTGYVDTLGASGYLINGNMQGKWMFYEEYAQVDKRRPTAIRFYNRNRLDSIFSYHYGKLNSKNRYVNGAEQGWQESYFYDTGLKREIYFIDKKGKRIYYKSWEIDGRLSRVEKLENSILVKYDIKNDFFSVTKKYKWGESVLYYKDSENEYMEAIIKERSGQKVAYILDYWNVKGEHCVKNGSGHLVEWHNDSTKYVDLQMKEGIIEGEYKEWSENGQLYKKRNFLAIDSTSAPTYHRIFGDLGDNYRCFHGLPEGKELNYYQNGSPRKEVNFVNGKKQGLEIEWDNKGNIWKKVRFENGELVEKIL